MAKKRKTTHIAHTVLDDDSAVPVQADIFVEGNPFRSLQGKFATTATGAGTKKQKKTVAGISSSAVSHNNAVPNKKAAVSQQVDVPAKQAYSSIKQADSSTARIRPSAMQSVFTTATSEQEERLFLRTMDSVQPLKKDTKKVYHAHKQEDAPIQTIASQPQERTPAKPKKQEQALSLEQEESLFLNAMKGVNDVVAKGREVLPEVVSTVKVAVKPAKETHIEFTLEHTGDFISGHVMGLDLAIVSSLRAGQIVSETHVDLHGFTVEQAYVELLQSIKLAYYKGHKAVLAVPGQGYNSLFGVGLIKQRVQGWLTQNPLNQVVLAFCTAKQNDGGNGALYILLRKQKKNSPKIQWGNTPVID